MHKQLFLIILALWIKQNCVVNTLQAAEVHYDEVDVGDESVDDAATKGSVMKKFNQPSYYDDGRVERAFHESIGGDVFIGAHLVLMVLQQRLQDFEILKSFDIKQLLYLRMLAYKGHLSQEESGRLMSLQGEALINFLTVLQAHELIEGEGTYCLHANGKKLIKEIQAFEFKVMHDQINTHFPEVEDLQDTFETLTSNCLHVLAVKKPATDYNNLSGEE